MAMTLEASRMKRETLDAMMSAIEKSLPKFHEYLSHKAKLLGHKNGLPWYDLFAPMGNNNKKYTVEESKEYLVNVFKAFNLSNLSSIIQIVDFFIGK